MAGSNDTQRLSASPSLIDYAAPMLQKVGGVFRNAATVESFAFLEQAREYNQLREWARSRVSATEVIGGNPALGDVQFAVLCLNLGGRPL
jgi:hypothetical protein